MQNESPTRRIVPATAAKPPTAAPNSVFAAGQAAKQKRTYERKPLDISTVEIRKGVPIPESKAPGRSSVYADLLARMKKGDSCELEHRNALSLKSVAKKAGVPLVLRKLTETHTGCWRTA